MDVKDILIVAYLVASVLFIIGIKQLSKVRTARQANGISTLGMLIAIVATLFDQNILSFEMILAGMVVGTAIGLIFALKVQMTGMPQMVALLNGFGGGASLLVGVGDYLKSGGPTDGFVDTTIFLSVLVGGVTFTGSIVAWGKLQGVFTEKSVILPARHAITAALLLISIVAGVFIALSPMDSYFALDSIGLASLSGNPMLYLIVVISLVLGVLLVIPIGGADMPVVISLLNSYSGIAATMTGFVLGNTVLIITGSLVGASGIILTQIMCKSMNRSLLNVLVGGFGATAGSSQPSGAKSDIVVKQIGTEEAAMLFDGAANVIIVPGYGMAVAQAQHVVRELSDLLTKRGANVRFAIHPVAGRMPGHMNVLLAEANVPYENLLEMDQINDDFTNTDVALVIGANDVTNPAARHDQSSPIFGMPILNVDKARTVIVVKRSLKPGYAGIDNELYGYPNCLMYLGDAKEAIAKLITEIKENN